MVDLRSAGDGGVDLLVDGVPWIRGATPRLSWREAGSTAWVDSPGSRLATARRTSCRSRDCPATARLEVRRLDEQSWRRFRRGHRLPPVKTQAEELWASLHVDWQRMADPVHRHPDWALVVVCPEMPAHALWMVEISGGRS